jgi:hypothetical protein
MWGFTAAPVTMMLFKRLVRPMSDLPKPTEDEVRQWHAEFEANSRRPLEVRLRYAFIKTYKPVMDDAKFRSFDSMEEYRQWCEKNLPSWLGYGRF